MHPPSHPLPIAEVRIFRWTIAMTLACIAPVWAMPSGLLFHASFDKLSTVADLAKGSPESTLRANLELRSAEGVKGAGLLQQPGERCTYQLAGNLDTSQGSFSVWVKPLSWSGNSGKFRHLLVVHGVPAYSMLAYLYPIGDEAVMNYIRVNADTPEEGKTSPIGSPPTLCPASGEGRAAIVGVTLGIRGH